MSQIKQIRGQEILDSRGLPTVQVSIQLSSGAEAAASVPSGTSKGIHEALELRDNDPKRYGGFGVLKAVENVNGVVAQTLTGMRSEEQQKIDDSLNQLDGTPMKNRLGANAILAVSLAVCRAQSIEQEIPLYRYLRENVMADSDQKYALPNLMVNVIEGGVHVKGGLDFQEFLVSPVGFRFFSEQVENVKKLIKSLKNLLDHKKIKYKGGLEGGFAPNLPTNEEGLKLIRESEKVEELFERGFALGLDIAGSNIYKDGFYNVRDKKEGLNREAYIDFIDGLVNKYKIFTIEDPIMENDLEGWQLLNTRVKAKTVLIGDDLITTNTRKLEEATNQEVLGGVIIKPNQIGTLSETINFALVARKKGLKLVVSHRSGETDDSFISDLAVALNADFAKIGAPRQRERIAKYDRLSKIEKDLYEEGE